MNVSRQSTTTASEDAVSMYLSFEDESNISFKSTLDAKNENEEHGLDDSKGNSTLEPQHDEEFCNTMKELSNVLAPLRSQSLNVLREFIISSTPSKIEDNLDNNAGVGTNLRRSLRLKGNVSINLENMDSKTEISLIGDKENIPNIQHTDKNMSIESVNCQKTEETLSDEKKEDSENASNSSEKIMTPVTLKCQSLNATESKSCEIKTKITNIPITSSSKIQLTESTCENANQMNKVGSLFSKSENISKSKTVEKKEKMHSVVRRSLCEPNLENNRPSRILPKNTTRYSSVNPSDAVNVARAAWPALSRNKYSVSKDSKKLEQIDEGVTLSQKSKSQTAARKSINPSHKSAIIGRKSVLPSSTSAPQRIPTVVKTTFNSSIRKTAPRRSMTDTMNNATSKCRSVLLLQNKLASSPMGARKKVSYRTSTSATSSDEAIQRSRPSRAAGGGIQTNKSTYNAKSEINLMCSDCGASYNTKAQLETHKRTHLKAIQEIKKTRAHGFSSNIGIAAVGNPSNNRCKYCDKTFAIERALHIHLLQHCSKIPAIERRKLNFDDMDHVNKPEIPHFRQTTKDLGNGGVDPLINLPVKTNADKIENNFKSLRSKIENILKKDEPREQSGKSQMAPPSSVKIKKKTAHSGVFRTPNKEIPCISCKQAFKNIIDYTNHMMTAHTTLSFSNNNNNDSDQID